MLKKGTFPPNFLNKSPYYEIKCQLHPSHPNNVATNVFHIQRKNLDDSELNTRLQINIVRGKGGLCQLSTVLSKIAGPRLFYRIFLVGVTWHGTN